jgi:hypothetical protein
VFDAAGGGLVKGAEKPFTRLPKSFVGYFVQLAEASKL